MPQVVFTQTLATIENKTANYQNVAIKGGIISIQKCSY